MLKLGAHEDLIDEVRYIVGHHHHSHSVESVNFKAVYDADLITNLEEGHKESPMDADRLARIVDTSFLTDSGSRRAREILRNTNRERRRIF